MKKAVLASLGVAGLIFGTDVARAAEVVTDPGLTAVTQSSWATQAASMAKDVAQVTSILQQAQMMYSLLNNPVALMEVAPGLLSGGQTTPLGSDINATLQLAGGLGKLASAAGSLARTVEAQNSFYLPAMNGNFNFNMLIQRANQTSAIQAQLQTMIQSMSARVAGLQVLQTQINAGGDVKTIATLQARMQTETAMAQNQGQQMQALLGLATIQAQVERQQYMQKAALDDNQFLAARTAASDGLVTFSPTGPAPALTSPTAAAAVASFPVAGQ